MPRPRKDGTVSAPPNKKRLTDAFVSTAKPRDRVVVWWDEKQPGLAWSIQPSGRQSYKVVYRFHGRPRWYHLGDARSIGLAEARKRAARIMARVADGEDPHAERMAERTAGTFAELADRYLKEYAQKNNKSWKQADALVRRFLVPKWGRLKPGTITRADVRAVIGKIEAPVMANQVLAAASAIFSWAAKQDVLTVNPCRGVDRNKTPSRERVLSDSEIALFWPEFDPTLKLILLTGQRPGEVAHMQRAHIVDGWWQMPGQPTANWPGTKNGQDHRVWLSEPAGALIDVHLSSRGVRSSTVMQKIVAKLGVERVTPHDLRRTFSSKVTSLGFGRDAMNRVTNHKEGGIADVYDRHQYSEENKRIMEAVAAHIIGLAEGRGGDNVVAAKFGR